VVSDDLAMQALSGTPAERALRALAAGCDLALYGLGDFGPTEEMLTLCPAVTATTVARLKAGRWVARTRRRPLNGVVLSAERDRLLS